MLILAFETTAKAGSVALLEDGKLLAESYQNTGLTHSQTLMVMAEDILKAAGKTMADVNAVAVAEAPVPSPVSASVWLLPRVLPGARSCPATVYPPWNPWR